MPFDATHMLILDGTKGRLGPASSPKNKPLVGSWTKILNWASINIVFHYIQQKISPKQNTQNYTNNKSTQIATKKTIQPIINLKKKKKKL